jgi:hypothetical protein
MAQCRAADSIFIYKFLAVFGGEAAKTNQKISRGSEVAPNPIPAYAGTEADVAINN